MHLHGECFLNTFFSGMGWVIFVMYMNEVDVYIPPWLAVSIYYTFDFCLTFYLAPNKWAFLFSEPGLIDVMTSFPVLIIMIIMKKTDHIAAWIVKLPAFRIYILFDHSFVFSSF
ncbi:hypothetical protein JH06_1885 [Blastocystis sp. subtype 4]|uniref:hypothetical protein n=1 Tax=Blastocystis sp. subtype 4 TaxID=944170 RepID=UPI000711DF78|nr:hypothetical protein JH06_1885 [Blastocystis sp. subtype 4]KNB44156.1 hypothetical protein JH06_1885 [Blastocystis sp. subtype 4]|eukprot:XP_014527599.1 hypothetical protein JH06_1885 [Blastocystis sp. subtype 4]